MNIERRRPWKSIEAVEFVVFQWVDWFNHLIEAGASCDWIPPPDSPSPERTLDGLAKLLEAAAELPPG